MKKTNKSHTDFAIQNPTPKLIILTINSTNFQQMRIPL
jgi:hypothetical protein